MTFEEAYRKTGRIFCVALSATAKKTPPILINYISAPNVTIASAVVASAAVPGFVAPQTLQIKDPDGTIRSAGPETYYDGSIRHDIPTEGLSEMLNCHFFVACQCNPHIVPFFFNVKGGVGQPSRWTGGEQETSWRGGFLLAALEMYLKNDMRAKFVFLQDLDAAVSFTGTLMTQSFVGTTTIVPQIELRDFFTLFSDPTVPQLYRCLKVGSVAAYQHAAMIRCHYRLADALEECIDKLEPDHRTPTTGINGGNSTNKSSNTNDDDFEPKFVVPIETPHKKKASRFDFGSGTGGYHRLPSQYAVPPRRPRTVPQQPPSQRPRSPVPLPRDRVPEIITGGGVTRTIIGGGYHRKSYSGGGGGSGGGSISQRIDSDSVSTASETCAPNP